MYTIIGTFLDSTLHTTIDCSELVMEWLPIVTGIKELFEVATSCKGNINWSSSCETVGTLVIRERPCSKQVCL